MIAALPRGERRSRGRGRVLRCGILFFALPRWVAMHRLMSRRVLRLQRRMPQNPSGRSGALVLRVGGMGHGLTGRRVRAGGTAPTPEHRRGRSSKAHSPLPFLVSAVPAGTLLRAVYVANGDAYVDVTGEVVTALANSGQCRRWSAPSCMKLPAITGVQILAGNKSIPSLETSTCDSL